MSSRRTIAFLLIVLLSLSGFLSAVLAEDSGGGTGQRKGWDIRDLVISQKDPKTKTIVETIPGKVYIKQTQTKFRLEITTVDGWQIMDSRIYVGYDPVPAAAGKIPITALFPFRQEFENPVDSYELSINMKEPCGPNADQEESPLGPREPGVDKMTVSVFLRMKGVGAKGEVLVKEAWARGTVGKDSFYFSTTDEAWWMTYDLDQANVMFRKNVSKEPECETTKAKIEILHAYVQARRANGTPGELGYTTIEELVVDTDGNPILDADGNPEYVESAVEIRNVVKPLISVYAQEVPGNNYPDIYTGEMTNCASDVFASVSLDEGNTWKVTNLSRAADRSSFTLGDASLYPGFEFPGEVKKPNVKQQGNTIMVAWTSKFARSGSPTYSLSEFMEDEAGYPLQATDAEGLLVYDENGDPVYVPNPYYEEDIWGVGGSQRSKDYTNVEAGFPGIEIPYSVVWTCRGFIQEDGTIVWMKPERLTSGRRDAEQVSIASSPTGYAVIWQEDPDGLRPGDGAGPGHGWSGATTNHKTDIWYTYITMEDFYKIDEDFVSGGEGYTGEDPDKGKGRPKALVPMKLPVRISDNDTLNLKNMKISASIDNLKEYTGADYPLADREKLFVLHEDGIVHDVPEAEETLEALSCDGDDGCGGSGGEGGSGKGDFLGSHRYGLADDSPLWRTDENGRYILFYEKYSNSPADPEIRHVAITADDVVLDGNTGGSRPNIMLQNYQKPDGTYSAWAVIGYEESKGTGTGPPDKDDEVEGDFDSCGCDDTDGDKEPGSGEGSTRYYPDRGKNVIYHSFDFQNPHTVSAGDVLNPQEVMLNDEGVEVLSWLVDKDGNEITDWKGERMPNYENARRPRFIIQSKANAIAGKAADEKGTVMVSVFKMGKEGKGRPSDIMMVRWEASKNDTGNPYQFKYLAKRDDDLYVEVGGKVVDWQNLSSVTPLDGGYTVEYTQKGEEFHRIYEWEQLEENLSDYTWTEPGLDARSHRGFIKGDFLAIAFNFTPNWRQARNGHDIYNCYIRRSFDGGHTWTTDPDGEGVTQWEILKKITSEAGAEETTFDRYVTETLTPAGAYQPARNVSLTKNNKVITIEPRLVGAPGTTWTNLTDTMKEILGTDFTPYKVDKDNPNRVILFPQDEQDADTFWMTYGTESTVTKDGGGGEAVDLFYSFSMDRGETFHNTSWDYLKSDEQEENGFQTWDWMAKDRRGIVMEQAESQIRYLPNGSVFYAVWNEASEEGSDAMFRRILRARAIGDIVKIEANTITEEPTSE